MGNYRFTVLTPCYNSEKFIDRVYDSLTNQEFKDFEWLVIDDASTDNTLKRLKEMKHTANFDMRIIANPTNQMLTKNLNLGFKEAQGKLIYFAGHDDTFIPSTLKDLDQVWKENGADNIAGIWMSCQNQHGERLGKKFPTDVFTGNYFDVFFEYLQGVEKSPCMRRDVVLQYPFETEIVDYIPEGVLWGRIGLSYDTIFLNKSYRMYFQEVDNPNALTKRSRAKMALSVIYQNEVWINEFFSKIPGRLSFKGRMYFSYALYHVIAGKSIFAGLKRINSSFERFAIMMIFPLAVFANKVLNVK